jgi:hypothetical protein
MRGGPVRWLAFRPLQLTAAQAIGGRPGLLVLAALLRALAPATLPAATQPAAQADVAEDDADRGALAAQPEAAAPNPNSRFDVMTRGRAGCVSSARRDLCGGRRAIAVLTRRAVCKGLRTTQSLVDIAWRILRLLWLSPIARGLRGLQDGLCSGPQAGRQPQCRGAWACHRISDRAFSSTAGAVPDGPRGRPRVRWPMLE